MGTVSLIFDSLNWSCGDQFVDDIKSSHLCDTWWDIILFYSPEGSYTDDANQEVCGPPQQHGHHSEFDDEFEDDDPLPAIGHCKAIYPFDGMIFLMHCIWLNCFLKVYMCTESLSV